MAVSYNGRKLSPASRGSKYAEELRTGMNSYTKQPLTPSQKAWRAGYNSARQDAVNVFKHNVKTGVIKQKFIDKKPHIVRPGVLKASWKS